MNLAPRGESANTKLPKLSLVCQAAPLPLKTCIYWIPNLDSTKLQEKVSISPRNPQGLDLSFHSKNVSK